MNAQENVTQVLASDAEIDKALTSFVKAKEDGNQNGLLFLRHKFLTSIGVKGFNAMPDIGMTVDKDGYKGNNPEFTSEDYTDKDGKERKRAISAFQTMFDATPHGKKLKADIDELAAEKDRNVNDNSALDTMRQRRTTGMNVIRNVVRLHRTLNAIHELAFAEIGILTDDPNASSLVTENNLPMKARKPILLQTKGNAQSLKFHSVGALLTLKPNDKMTTLDELLKSGKGKKGTNKAGAGTNDSIILKDAASFDRSLVQINTYLDDADNMKAIQTSENEETARTLQTLFKQLTLATKGTKLGGAMAKLKQVADAKAS